MNSLSSRERDSLLAAGKDLMRSGRLAEAERTFDDIPAGAPDDPDALHLMGLIRFRAGAPADAVGYIERAIGLAGPNADYLHNLRQIHHLTADFEKAAECFQRALDIDPGYPDAHLNLGHALLRMGRPGDAAEFDLALGLGCGTGLVGEEFRTPLNTP